MVSRVLGLVRDAVLAAFFGLGAVTDAFFVAFMVPNLFRRLFGEGALSAAFIPTYADLLQRDHALARRLATAIVAGVAAFVGLLTVLLEVALYIALTSRRWSYDTELAIRLTMLMAPFTPMICTVALVGGVLQVKGRFASQNIAPTLMNLVVIAATLLACSGVPPNSRSPMIHAVAASVVLAGVIQLVWVIGSAWRLRSFGLGVSGLRGPTLAILRMMGPMVLGLGVLQINTLMDNVIAMALSPKQGGPTQLHLLGWRLNYPIPDNGAVAALTLAQRLYQFPIGVFAVALATAIFPALARAASLNDRGELDKDAFQRILANGLRLTLFISLPASLGLVLVRVPLARVIFERGEFKTPDALRVAGVLAAYSAAVWAYSITQVVTRAFYALQRPRAPLAISLRMVLLNIVGNLSLVWVTGVSGLAWATSLCAIVQAAWLLRALAREGGGPLSPEVWRSWRQSVALSLAMAPPLLLASWAWDPATLSRAGCGLLLAGMVVLGMVVFAGGARALNMPELRWLLRRRVTG
jgi:putative peptidoglycan lipid II flippase